MSLSPWYWVHSYKAFWNGVWRNISDLKFHEIMRREVQRFFNRPDTNLVASGDLSDLKFNDLIEDSVCSNGVVTQKYGVNLYVCFRDDISTLRDLHSETLLPVLAHRSLISRKSVVVSLICSNHAYLC